jgi:hypothetical protein
VTDRTDDHEGRERITERDREADMGERTQEYRRGEVTDGDDPLARARAAAVQENSDHGSNRPPGVTPLEEEWQREKQMSGQDADEPGLPAGWRGEAEGGSHRETGAGQDSAAGRDDVVVPSGAGSSADDREDPGTGTGSDRMGKPERADELPDSADVTQG